MMFNCFSRLIDCFFVVFIRFERFFSFICNSKIYVRRLQREFFILPSHLFLNTYPEIIAVSTVVSVFPHNCHIENFESVGWYKYGNSIFIVDFQSIQFNNNCTDLIYYYESLLNIMSCIYSCSCHILNFVFTPLKMLYLHPPSKLRIYNMTFFRKFILQKYSFLLRKASG